MLCVIPSQLVTWYSFVLPIYLPRGCCTAADSNPSVLAPRVIAGLRYRSLVWRDYCRWWFGCWCRTLRGENICSSSLNLTSGRLWLLDCLESTEFYVAEHRFSLDWSWLTFWRWEMLFGGIDGMWTNVDLSSPCLISVDGCWSPFPLGAFDAPFLMSDYSYIYKM